MSHPATIDPGGMMRGAASGAELDAHAASLIAHGGGGGRSGAILQAAAGQAILAGAKAVWDTPALYDPDGYWLPAAPTRLTVPAGKGTRLFLAHCRLEANDAGTYRIAVFVNGVSLILGENAADYAHTVNAVLLLADGAYVEAALAKNGGGTATTIVTDMPSRFALVPL